MSEPSSVLVVGASAAGLATVEALRRKGYRGSLTVLGAEEHPPYDRPPLSKQVLSGQWQPERARLRSPEALSALEAEWVLGDAAVALDPVARTVRSESGRVLRADTIVVATGARPRTLPGQAGLRGVHVLRTLDDAVALRADLLGASRLVVVGEGVLGAEITATARGLGLAVTMAGPEAAPMAAQVGPGVAEQLARLHTDHGARLRLGSAVTGLTGKDGRVRGVCLDSGEVLPADVVVVAVGARPATDWLADSGLPVADGLVCDSRCRAAEGIYAVGDVARWRHDVLGALTRLENRTNASEQAGAVAADILGAELPYTPIPYLWTDQYEARIQVYGVPSADADTTVVDGDPAEGRFVALYRREGAVTGVLGWNMAKRARAWRREIVDARHEPAPTGR